MSSDKLVYMANQIATYFATQPGEGQAAAVASHIRDFWEPRMREKLLVLVDAGDSGLSPLALDAALQLRADRAA